NYGHYSDPEMDKLLDEAREVSGFAKRKALYAKVWQVERKNMPLIYLYIAKNTVGMKKSLMGFKQVPDGIIRLQGMHFAK
ncbi:MAG: hypothetical protein ACREF1_03990, partial [Acetobacteraceae bacterium]